VKKGSIEQRIKLTDYALANARNHTPRDHDILGHDRWSRLVLVAFMYAIRSGRKTVNNDRLWHGWQYWREETQTAR
jgi:hypothetical protein